MSLRREVGDRTRLVLGPRFTWAIINAKVGEYLIPTRIDGTSVYKMEEREVPGHVFEKFRPFLIKFKACQRTESLRENTDQV